MELEQALIKACKNNQLSVVKVLAAKKSNLDYADDYGKTAVHYCAECGNIDTVKELIKAGADAGRIDNRSNNLLHLSAGTRNKELVKYLLSLNVIDINSKNQYGETPLFIAVWNGNRDMVELLLKAGARDLPNNVSKTALDIASGNGAAGIVELLIEAEINTTLSHEE